MRLASVVSSGAEGASSAARTAASMEAAAKAAATRRMVCKGTPATQTQVYAQHGGTVNEFLAYGAAGSNVVPCGRLPTRS